MDTKHVHFVYFSPTGTTKKVLNAMAKGLNRPFTNYNFTPYHQSYQNINMGCDELLVIGIPVYSGRVPPIFVNRISYQKGENTPAVLVATYGSREYDDALIELKALLIKNGFIPIAAAAFAVEHNVNRKVGTGRPDGKDCEEIQAFATRVVKKLDEMNSLSDYDLRVKGNPIYRKFMELPIKPHSTKGCTKCGACAKLCPADAIPLESPNKTDKAKCICCMSCTRCCPTNARSLSVGKNLEPSYICQNIRDTKNMNTLYSNIIFVI